MPSNCTTEATICKNLAMKNLEKLNQPRIEIRQTLSGNPSGRNS
jgi:hypothetical protein